MTRPALELLTAADDGSPSPVGGCVGLLAMAASAAVSLYGLWWLGPPARRMVTATATVRDRRPRWRYAGEFTTPEVDGMADTPERVWSKVDRSGGPDACWPWTASLDRWGYGQVRWRGTILRAHRVTWELEHGAPPDGELDHTCRRRPCVNPSHLEDVDRRTNQLRGDTLAAANAAKDACLHGHPFTPENTYTGRRGRRERACRTCKRERDRAYRARRRDA